MHNIEPGNILNTAKELLEKSAYLFFLHPLVLHDVVKELTPGGVLHDKVQFFLSLNNFIQLDHLGMLHNFQNVNFPRNPLYISNVYDF